MTTQTAEMKSVPVNTTRGMTGLIGFALISIGSGMIWGPGGMMLGAGIVLIVSCTIDEVVERITCLKRERK